MPKNKKYPGIIAGQFAISEKNDTARHNSHVFTVMCISFDRLASDKDRKVVQPT